MLAAFSSFAFDNSVSRQPLIRSIVSTSMFAARLQPHFASELRRWMRLLGAHLPYCSQPFVLFPTLVLGGLLNHPIVRSLIDT